MKKKISILILISILFLLSASPWEGSAVTAPEGELPVKGLFVATNSFPINTIVEITNIESNKTTRAIVAKGLDSPGLLAVVSLETADLIGMRSGSISRVRMVQPSDPIAYLRFIEGQAQGIPPYDSGAVITEENYKPVIVIPSEPSPQVQPVSPRPVTGPSYVLEPEWRRDEIITLYNGTETEPLTIAEERKELDIIAKDIIEASEYAEPEYIVDDYKELGIYGKDTLFIEEEHEYITEDFKELDLFGKEIEIEFITEEYKELSIFGKEEEPEYITEELKELGIFGKEEEPEFITEDFKELGIFEKEGETEYIVEENKELDFFGKELEPEYITEEYKELLIFEKESLDEIEHIVEEYKVLDYFEKEFSEESEYITDAYKDLEGYEKIEYAIVPADERPPEIYGIDPNDLFPVTPEPQITVKPDDTKFSAPRVTQLNNGFYYVQIASYDTPEPVENILNNIDHRYKPLVLNTGDKMFQVLLGPMNQGESAAVLARFKSIGYRDAFVRHVR